MRTENKFQTTQLKIPTIRKKIGLTTINQMIEQSCSLYGNKTSLVKISKNELVNYSYNDVFNYLTKIARYLKELGVKKGDHIGIIGDNSPEWAISYFAVSWIGAVAIPIDAKASSDTIKNIVKLSKPTVIFFSNSLKKLIEETNYNLKNSIQLIQMEDFEVIYSKYSKGIDKETLTSSDLIDILFTSGTTGNPKGVMLSHGNIMSNVEDVYSFLDINQTDRAFSILPIHHSYERTGGLLSTFYCGMSVYYGRGLKPREMLEDLKTTKPTVWLNTPLLLEKLYSRIRKELESQKGLKRIITTYLPRKILGNKIKKQLGLEDIKLIVSGGAALPFWISQGLSELGFNIIQGYGLSEASPLITANPPSNPKNESVGMVIQSDEVEIRDLDNDNNGEIYAKGPNIMKGYFENPAATNEVLTNDGWLKTGDIGYFDEHGYLYITGRKKYVIVTPGGKNIFPEEIEEKLSQSKYIEESMVFSLDDNEIQALIYPNLDEVCLTLNKDSVNEAEVIKLIDTEIREINKNSESYKRINRFKIREEEFPKTSTRKIKRYMFKNINLNNDVKYL